MLLNSPFLNTRPCLTPLCPTCKLFWQSCKPLAGGVQAEYVRVPHADCGLHAVPPGLDDAAACMFSDIYPTSYECAALHRLVSMVEHSARTERTTQFYLLATIQVNTCVRCGTSS